MKRNPPWLLEHIADVYSDSGEDGVIGQALELLPERDNWCVEFGAYDATSLSNTRNLIENLGYSAVLIEGSRERFANIEREYAHNDAVTTIRAMVGWSRNDCLDAIMDKLPIPRRFDFLSIDIDGNDYHVWEATQVFRPKLVCIEFNPTIPTEVSFVQPRDTSVNQGSSVLALVELAHRKGYELISVLHHAAFFVDSPYYPLFDIPDNSPYALRKNLDSITYLFSGYDGTVHLVGNGKLPWHDVTLRESQMQVLPKRLRKYPPDFSIFARLLSAAHLLRTSPAEFVRTARRHL